MRLVIHTLELASGNLVIEHLVDVFERAAVRFLYVISLGGAGRLFAVLTGMKKKTKVAVIRLDPSQIKPTVTIC